MDESRKLSTKESIQQGIRASLRPKRSIEVERSLAEFHSKIGAALAGNLNQRAKLDRKQELEAMEARKAKGKA